MAQYVRPWRQAEPFRMRTRDWIVEVLRIIGLTAFVLLLFAAVLVGVFVLGAAVEAVPA